MQILGPDVYSMVQASAESAVVEHMTAAGQHQQISAQWMSKADTLASSSGEVVDAGVVQAQTMAAAHQNQARLHEECADYHRRAASLAGSMNDALDRVEARAQQQLASAKAWDWPKIIAEARTQAGQINSGFATTLGQRHAASMGSMAPVRAAITALGSGTSGAASMMGAGTGLGSVPLTGLGSMPPLTPVPGPGPTPSPTPSAGSAPSSSSPQAGPPAAPQAAVGALPGKPPPPDPQTDPAATDDNPDDDDLGGDTGGGDGQDMTQMLPELLTGVLTGVLGAVASIPQALSEAGSELMSQATQGLSSLADQTEPDDTEDPEDVTLPASSSSGGGGVSGGAGGAGGAAGEHLSAPATPAATPAAPVEQAPVAEPPAPAAAAMGGMPGMMPMGMGAGGSGPTTAAADNKTRKVVTPHDPDTVTTTEPTVTVAVDNPSGSPPTLLRTLNRVTG